MVSGARCSDCRESIHEPVDERDEEPLCKRCRDLELDEIAEVRREERKQPVAIESHGPSNFGRGPGEIPGSAIVSSIAVREAIEEYEGRRDRAVGVVVFASAGLTLGLWVLCWWLDSYIESMPPL